MSTKRVLVTGASGLLGRAVVATFKRLEWTVLGTAFSRCGNDLVRVDICDVPQVTKVIEDFKPMCIVHCAAQRFPDKVDNDVEGTIKLNVEATKNLAILAAKLGIVMLYISSDYVFDGTSPPYNIDSKPNPLNQYGKTKLGGEHVTLEASTDHIVLRIPVLYGEVEYLGESAVTVLLELLFQSTTKSISDCEIRCPSHVNDIAAVCAKLMELRLKNPNVKGIFHWGGKENLTKYGMVVLMSEVFGLKMDHIIPDPNPVPGAPRPHNAQLSNVELEKLNIGHHTPFRTGIDAALRSWVERLQNKEM